MNDKDVKSEMKRADMETICASLFQRAEETMKKCLQQSGKFFYIQDNLIISSSVKNI